MGKTELYQVISRSLNSKERTAKVYAATIRRIHREVYNTELDDLFMKFIEKAKTFNYVKKIVNLTRRKNAATAMLIGLKTVEGSDKMREKYRKVMMAADKDYQAFLVSGKRKRPFENAEAAWGKVIELHKKVAKEIDGRRLWELGESVNASEYKVLMSWVYLKWISTMAPRRLEYSNTQMVTKKEYEESDKKGNYIVMGKRKWYWHIHRYKTVERYGPQILPVPGPLKVALNKILPIAKAKNDKGFIFLNNKFRMFSKSQFSTFVKSVFQKYAGKPWTQNTVRSIKVSSVWKPGTENPLQLAREMGHNVQTAILHYKL